MIRLLSLFSLCVLSCLGCEKGPVHEFSAKFDVQPSLDGRQIVWCLRFNPDQYHAMLDLTQNGTEVGKVRELIATGLKMHNLSACAPHEQVVTRLENGDIAFVGTCALDSDYGQSGTT